MRTLGKRVKVNSLSRVRIPLSPPKPLLVNALKVLKTMRRMCFKDIYFRRIDYD